MFSMLALAAVRIALTAAAAENGLLADCARPAEQHDRGSSATAQPEYVLKPLAERKLKQLPAGPLYWDVENFPTLAHARAAAGATSLVTEVEGKAWLFTLGPKGGAPGRGTRVAEIGPVPMIVAPEYLLRINSAGGAPGARTPVHTHPGSEAFYVLAGRVGQTTAHRNVSTLGKPCRDTARTHRWWSSTQAIAI